MLSSAGLPLAGLQQRTGAQRPSFHHKPERRVEERETVARPRRLNWTNILFLLGTLLVAAVGTPWYLWKYGFGLAEWLTFFAIWVGTGLSVTAGYHRLFAHKTYQA